MNNTTVRIVILSLLLFIGVIHIHANHIGEAAKGVIARQIGKRANEITFKQLSDKSGKEMFALQAKEGKLTIEGTSTVSMCYAFTRYMREACKMQATWSGNNGALPAVWPEYEMNRQESPYSLRYFLNVCTFGYTTPYWDWARWEKELDWMALRGVNMPLASVASEAIAERVWLRMGLKKSEIRDFFTAPAHLPWHRMGNLNKWDGPLSDSWQKGQIALQHKIINRMRELGMNPVAPAFAGFVPMAFAEKHPEIDFKHMTWGGFDEKFNAYVLPPDSPYFEKIGKLFIQEWEKEFGKNTYYLSDSFNEMRLPLDPNDKEGKYRLLAGYGESIYHSIKAGNKNAVWVTQGWTFGYQHDFWDKESLKALFSKVPDDKMIIIDLGNDYPKWVWHTEQTWKVQDGFHGKKWIFSYVPNFGGKTLMTGDLSMYASSSSEALNSPNKGNLVGFGSAPEGLENNEVVYELLADMGWTTNTINLDEWMKDYCEARYGGYPTNIANAWKKFRKSVYHSLYSYPRFTWQTVVPDKRRISKTDMDNPTFLSGVEDFLMSADDRKGSPLYVNDAIELASYYAAVKADRLYKSALAADSIGDVTVKDAMLESAISILTQVDRLLKSHPTCQLATWVALARNQGTNAKEKDAYEANAKRLITTWGGFQEDYAARFWSGLIADYYIPRMKLYFSSNRGDLENWEEKWITNPWQDKTQSFADPLAEAVILVKMLKSL